MARLIQDDAQVKALEEINAQLEEVRIINGRLSSTDPFFIEVSKKISIKVDESLAPKLIAVLKAQKNRRIKEITAKAAKFRIALSDEDKTQLMGDSMAEAD